MSESLQKGTTARFKNYQHIAAAAAAPRSNDARNAQQRCRVASRRIASPKRHRASSDSHRGTHLRRESPAIAKNIQANLKMTNEDWLAQLREVETEERRKDEAGAKAAQELADKQQRHLNKKVREDDPLCPYPINCTHRISSRLNLTVGRKLTAAAPPRHSPSPAQAHRTACETPACVSAASISSTETWDQVPP